MLSSVTDDSVCVCGGATCGEYTVLYSVVMLLGNVYSSTEGRSATGHKGDSAVTLEVRARAPQRSLLFIGSPHHNSHLLCIY